MSFVLMQPDDSAESENIMEILIPYEDNSSDTQLSSAKAAAHSCRLLAMY